MPVASGRNMASDWLVSKEKITLALYYSAYAASCFLIMVSLRRILISLKYDRTMGMRDFGLHNKLISILLLMLLLVTKSKEAMSITMSLIIKMSIIIIFLVYGKCL